MRLYIFNEINLNDNFRFCISLNQLVFIASNRRCNGCCSAIASSDSHLSMFLISLVFTKSIWVLGKQTFIFIYNKVFGLALECDLPRDDVIWRKKRHIHMHKYTHYRVYAGRYHRSARDWPVASLTIKKNNYNKPNQWMDKMYFNIYPTF